jgi:hypothetical protein
MLHKNTGYILYGKGNCVKCEVLCSILYIFSIQCESYCCNRSYIVVISLIVVVHIYLKICIEKTGKTQGVAENYSENRDVFEIFY